MMRFHEVKSLAFWTGLFMAGVSFALYALPQLISQERAVHTGYIGINIALWLMAMWGLLEVIDAFWTSDGSTSTASDEESTSEVNAELTSQPTMVTASSQNTAAETGDANSLSEPTTSTAEFESRMEDNNEDCGYRPEDSMFAYRDTVERFVSRKLAQLAEKKNVMAWEVSPPFAGLNSVTIDINPRENTRLLFDTNFKSELLTLLPEGAELRAADRTHRHPRIVYPRDERQFIPTADALNSFEVFCRLNRAPHTTALLGFDEDMQLVSADIASLPHLLILGTSGSGKGVSTHNILLSVLLRSTPDELQLVRIDPKQTEFKVYDALPHSLGERAIGVENTFSRLDWLVREADQRQAMFAEHDCHNLAGYNKRHKKNPLPRILVVFDELTKFHETISDYVYEHELKDSEAVKLVKQLNGKLINLVTSARSAGIHLMLVTQNAKDTIPGKLISELSGRLYFKIKKHAAQSSEADKGDLDQVEYLTGLGDGFWMLDDKTQRLQAPSIVEPEEELPVLVATIRQRYADFDRPDDPFVAEPTVVDDEPGVVRLASDDPLYLTVLRHVAEQGRVSRPMLEQLDGINRARAESLLAAMEQDGFLKNNGAKRARTVLIKPTDVSAIMRKIGLHEVASV